MKRNSLNMGIIVFFFICLVLYLVWFCLPIYQFNHDVNYANYMNHTNDTDYSIAKATLENEYRTNGLQVLGGLLVIAGLIFTYSNYSFSRDNQLTDRYNSAIKNLGQEKIELKLVGISDLETISQEYDKYYWQTMETLTAYVRNNSIVDIQLKEKFLKIVPISMDIEANESTKSDFSKVKPVSSDIQAILTVIVGRKHSFGSGEINRLNLQRTSLQYTDLSGANFSGANLSEGDLSGVNLSGSNLSEALLSRVNLSKAILSKAVLSGADLSEADFSMADLSQADLSGADLSGADLSRANFFGANFSGANLSDVNLSEGLLSFADLSQALLSRANLSRAHLSLANLEGANLEGANFSGAYLNGTRLRSASVHVHRPPAVTLNETPEEFHISTGLCQKI